jgi:hypothetical protein
MDLVFLLCSIATQLSGWHRGLWQYYKLFALLQMMQLVLPLQILQIQHNSSTLHTCQGIQRGIFTMMSQPAFS